MWLLRCAIFARIQGKPCSYCVTSFCGSTGTPKSPGIQRCAVVVRTLSEREGVRCQGLSRPTKQRSIARSQPSACPTSSAIINCLGVPGLRSTRARNKLLNTTKSPTLYQKVRVRIPRLVLTLPLSLFGTPVEMLCFTLPPDTYISGLLFSYIH